MKSKKPGRPPVPIAERKTYVYPVRLNKAQHKTLVKLSKTEDTPVSVVIRNMVDEYFIRQLQEVTITSTSQYQDNMNPTQQIGALIRMRRKERRMTHEQLAEASGISRSTIANIEDGRHHSKLDTLSAIAKAMDSEIVVSLK